MKIDSQTNMISPGIQLPSTGGTPANLNYYEEYSGSIILGGPFANQSTTLTIYRIGKICSVILFAVVGAANGSGGPIVSTTTIPARFFPLTNASCVVDSEDGLADKLGLCVFGADGFIRLYAGPAYSFFGTTGTVGITSNPCFSYLIA